MRKALLLSVLSLYILLFCSFSMKGQDTFSLRVQFMDSLQADAGSYFVYSQISIRNNLKTANSVHLNLSPPYGWKLLGQPNMTFQLFPDSTQYIPVTLLRQRDARARWEPLQLHFANDRGSTLLDTFLVMKAPLINEFSVLALQTDFEMEVGVDQLQVPIKLYNKGTTDGVYSIAVKNSFIEFEKNNFLRIVAGRDTNFLLPIKLPSSLAKNDDRFVLQIADSNGNSRSLPIAFSRVYRSLKLHPSRYKTFPLSIETGSFLVDRQFYYFLDANASFIMKEGALDLSFRTKTFGPMRTVERNLLTVNWRTSRMDLSFGHLSQIRHFYAYGRGLRMALKDKLGNVVGIEGIVPQKSNVQTNNNFSIHFQHFSKKINWWHQFAFDLNKRRGLNAYLLFHEAQLKISSTSTLKVNFSTGWEDFTRLSVFSNNDLGLGVGYSYQGNYKNWDWQSSWQYHQKSYPGVNKGARTISQLLRRKFGKSSLELSFQYNSTTSSLLQDTIYIADAFFFNMEKVGGKWSWGTEKTSLSLGTGLFRQTGLSAGQLPRYQFGEFAFSARFSSTMKLSISSFTGYANNTLVNQPIWLTNSTMDWQYKRMGVKAFYVQQPLLKDSVLKYLIRYNQTVLLSPFINFRFFRQLNGSVRYSISKSLYDDRTTTSLGFNMFFKIKKGDWQISVNGAIPFSRSMAPGTAGFSFPYLSFSVKKKLQLPALYKRRYHDLKVVAFEDVNLNGIPDTGDRKLPDCRIRVNNKQFLTDRDGSIFLKNADTGSYTIEVQPGILYKGLIPSPRNKVIVLHHSKEVLIPFRKGHEVYGKVQLDLDPYSGFKFTPDNILVRALDSLGKEFSVLTDSAGRFSIPLPAGRYILSLNPTAFTGAIRPEKLSFPVDLSTTGVQEVNFKLIQRRREIRMRQR